MVTWHNELSLEGYVILKPNINKIKSMKMPVLMCELLTNNFPPNKKWKWFQQRRGNIFCGIDGTFLIMMIISEKYIHIKKNTDPPSPPTSSSRFLPEKVPSLSTPPVGRIDLQSMILLLGFYTANSDTGS